MAKGISNGDKIEIQIGSTLTEIRGLTSIPAPSVTVPEIDVTSLDSTGAEFLAGLPDPGTLDLSGFFDKADPGQIHVLQQSVAASKSSFNTVVTKDGRTWTFTAYVAAANVGSEVNGARAFTASLRATGAVTFGGS